MPTTRTLKNRIKATKNIEQITKAMQAVSAVKMRRSEQAAIGSRPYALSALEMLKNVRKALEQTEESSPLIDSRPAKKSVLVVIASDKGLAGSFNSNVLRKSQEFVNASENDVEIVAVGKRSKEFWNRRGKKIVQEFFGGGDYVSLSDTLPIAKYVQSLYMSGEYREINLIYTNYLSALKQQVVIRKILPVSVEALEKITRDIIPQSGLYSGMPQSVDRALDSDIKQYDYKFEPSPIEVLNDLLPQLVNIEIHQSILEANASEHSSRMVAMKSASDNAGDLIKGLRITYNKLRQGAITKELTEISAGTEALRQN